MPWRDPDWVLDWVGDLLNRRSAVEGELRRLARAARPGPISVTAAELQALADRLSIRSDLLATPGGDA